MPVELANAECNTTGFGTHVFDTRVHLQVIEDQRAVDFRLVESNTAFLFCSRLRQKFKDGVFICSKTLISAGALCCRSLAADTVAVAVEMSSISRLLAWHQRHYPLVER